MARAGSFLSLPLASALPPAGQAGSSDAGPGAPAAAIERWKDLRFGMFIHWGPVSILGTEIGWSRGGERRGLKGAGDVPVEVYDNLYRMFNSVKFDPDAWVQLAKDRGMKYLVFTTKHHDGFCNFDTKVTDYKITSPRSPYRKDIVRMLSDACGRGGIDWGVYYSQPDWHHPDYRNGEAHSRYIQYLHGQVRELLANYGPTRMWFFDGLGGTAADWDAPRLIRMMRAMEPGLIINNRAGVPADYDTPEQRIGTFQDNRPWETCATVGTQWAYKPEDTLRSLQECLRGAEERLALRQRESRPVLEKRHGYLLEIQTEVLPKSPEGRAVQLGRAEPLLRGWRSGDRQQRHRAEHSRRGGRPPLCAGANYAQSAAVWTGGRAKAGRSSGVDGHFRSIASGSRLYIIRAPGGTAECGRWDDTVSA